MREALTILKAAGVALDRSVHGLSPRSLLRDPRIPLVGLLQATTPTVLPLLPIPVATALYATAARGPLGRLQIYGSTWQSLMRNRSTEIDYLNGEITRLAGLHGLVAPLNARIVDAVHQVEATHQFVSVEALWPLGATT
jgi:hypothetical protein